MFECLCLEKAGPIWRTVFIPLVTVPWAMETLEKLEQVENFLPKNREIEFLLNSDNRFIAVDDIGLVAVCPTEYDRILEVHITFWDRRLRGREKLCKSIAHWLKGLLRKELVTLIPQDRRVLLSFTQRVGFQITNQVGDKLLLHFTNYPG